MATLATVISSRTGSVFTPVAAAAGGDQFLNTGREILYVKNGSGASINVTLAPAGTPGGLALSSYVVAVPAAGERVIGPFDPGSFNNASGYIPVTYSAATTVTVAVVMVP